jgi:hypothetical protein
MTTNLAFSDWPTIFPNVTCATPSSIGPSITPSSSPSGDSYRRREAEADKKARRSKKTA